MFHPKIEENGMLASGSLFDKWDSKNDLINVFYAIENIL
jgi:ubiquitin-protein ligase